MDRHLRLILVCAVVSSLVCRVAPVHAADTVPPQVTKFAKTGERVVALESVLVGSQRYHIYYFCTGSRKDTSGRIFYQETPQDWQRMGIDGILVMDDSGPVTDPDLLRRVFYCLLFGYMLHDSGVGDLFPFDRSLVEHNRELTDNPLYQVVFGEQALQSLLTTRKEQDLEALRLMLTSEPEKVALAADFGETLQETMKSANTVEGAIDQAIQVGKYSNDPNIRELAKDLRATFKGWEKATEGGRVYLKGTGIKVEFINGLDLVALAAQLILPANLSHERAMMLKGFASEARAGRISVDPDLLDAIDLAVAEAESAYQQRGDIIIQFIRDKAGDLLTSLGKKALAYLLVKWSWNTFGKRVAGHLVAGSVSTILLAPTFAVLLFGFDAIYEHTIIAQRAAQVMDEFGNMINLLRLSSAQSPTYTETTANLFGTCYLFRQLAMAAVYRSNADIISGCRFKPIADLVQGGAWTKAEEAFRGWADELENLLETTIFRPEIIDYAITLAIGRAGMLPGRQQLSTSTVLVLDISGSMDDAHQGTRKIDAAKDAATDVLNMAEHESGIGEVSHQVAIATFSSEAQLNLPLTTDYSAARSVVATLGPTNRTNIGAGLDTANKALEDAPVGSTKIAILLSDGLTNEGLPPAEILSGPVQEAVSAGTCIYTIGFGDPGNLDEALLGSIASATGCKYYYAADAYQLENVYVRLRHESLGAVIGEFSGQVQQSQTVTAGRVLVSPNQGQLYATATWPGSALDLILTDPTGRKVDAQYSGATISTFEKLVYVIVENPLAGEWLVDVFGRDVPQGTTTYNAVLSVRERVVEPTDYSGLIAVVLTLVVGVLCAVLITRTSATRAGLFLVEGRGPARFLPIRGASFSIGRDPRGNLVLADGKVSRNHARITRDASGHVIQDLNSTNGTFVNGQAIRQQRLRNGDQIRVGDTKMAFRG